MLIHIWTTPALWDRTRREILPFAKVTAGSKILSVSESPRIQLNITGLRELCPLLTACLTECVGRYFAPVSLTKIKKTFNVRDGKSKTNSQAQFTSFHGQAGDFVATVSTPLQHSKEAFESIAASNAIASGSSSKGAGLAVNLGKISEGTALSVDMENETVVAGVLSIVAGILALWDFTPTSKKLWEVPKPRTTSPSQKPATDFRIMIAQRDLENDADLV